MDVSEAQPQAIRQHQGGTQPMYVCMPSLPVGQKPTCGRGLEGPWERPPPLDEPQRDGNSEDQVESRATLSGEFGVWAAEVGGNLMGQAWPDSSLLVFQSLERSLSIPAPLSLAHKLRAL